MNVGDLVAGKYRLERVLGEGGMGTVWHATHTLTQREHALKFVRSTKANDDATRKRMLREARATSAVRHPSVASIDDVVEAADGSPVLVMDLLRGETLGARLAREGRLDVVEAVRIARALFEGLSAAHDAGIVHRDLKPENVFLVETSDGCPPTPKILDFGVAKLTAADGPARATNLLTESSAMLGTPCYMAPEQAFGEGDVDARADLWAVGVILYEALAGVRPAEGATLGQVLKILATNAIVPLAEREPSVPPKLAGLVDRLLSSDPGGRPASAHEARRTLDELDEQQELAAAAEPASSQRPPRARLRLAIVPLALALFAIPATLFVRTRAPSLPSLPSLPSPPPSATLALPAAPAPAPDPAPASALAPASASASVARVVAPSPPSARRPKPALAPSSSPADSKLLTVPPF